MAALIFELAQKGLHQYHNIDKPIVRIGRAFDNDIILSDITVSPHHALIEQSANGLTTLRNLSHENPLRVDGNLIENAIEIENFPSHLDIGRLQARLMPIDTEVATTRHAGCQSFTRCLIQNPLSATLLYLSVLATSVLVFLSGLLVPIKWPELLLETGAVAIGIIILAMAITGITRVAGHRWELSPAIAIVSLIFLLSEIIGVTSHIISYVLSNPLISDITDIILIVFLTPLMLWLFLTRISHINKLPANIIALVMIVPLAYSMYSTHAKTLGFNHSFSAHANYDNNLLPWDYRFKPTLSIDRFISESQLIKAGKVIKP